jgi:hypothetical protein
VVYMRRYVILPFLLLVMMMAGCSSNNDKLAGMDNDEVKQLTAQKQGHNTVKASEEQDIKLSRSLQFGKVFKDEADIVIFNEAIDTATRINGILDIRRPDYDVVRSTKNAALAIHLWLDDEHDYGMYTLVSDTGTGYTLTEKSVSSLKQLIKNIRYNPEQAVQNGDIVNVHGNLTNSDKWEAFLTNIEARTTDQVQITSYTIEGDPIFYNLYYDGQSIQYTYDNTMDNYGSSRRSTAFCERVESELTDRGTQYVLAGCGEGHSDIEQSFLLILPMTKQ